MIPKRLLFPALFLLLAGLGFVGRYLYKTPAMGIGDKPVLEMQLANGQPFSLSKMNGKYVLLDFWGSWCGPCIAEMPKIKRMREGLVAKGIPFEVVSLAAEQDSNRWASTVEHLGMNWPNHYLGLQMFESPVFKQFGVRVIPAKLLVNKEGKIIATNLSIVEMEQLIEQGK
jgi:thiol-disulfide isomerase/thioredoxin